MAATHELTEDEVFLPGLALITVSFAGLTARAQAAAAPQQPVQQQPGQEQTVQDNGGVVKAPATAEKPDPLKRRLSDREERTRRKATVAELKGEYKKWLDEDVRWIIT